MLRAEPLNKWETSWALLKGRKGKSLWRGRLCCQGGGGEKQGQCCWEGSLIWRPSQRPRCSNTCGQLASSSSQLPGTQ